MMDMPPCFNEVAEHYQVPETVLMAVRIQEGGKVGQVVGPNSDGSYDLGPMQINTWWWGDHPRSLHKLGITQESVLNDFCQNIAVGAWILSVNYDSYGNWADAISAYNRGSPTKEAYDYLSKVLNRHIKLTTDSKD